MPKEIPLSQGKVTIVDDEDFDALSQLRWHAHVAGNGKSYVYHSITENTKLIMHRVIANAQPGEEVDHIDQNPLNNQRSNLRVCSRSQNMRNQGARKHNKVGLKGVTFCKEYGKYRSVIRGEGKSRHLGYFKTPIEAAMAYNRAAIQYHGEFAKLNTLAAQ